MWNKKDTSASFAAGGTTLISKTTKITGDVEFSGNLEVEGSIVGNVRAEKGSDARVRVLEQGSIEGEISVPVVVINGLVKGDVYSSSHVELAAKAQVFGDVHYAVIEMLKGAHVNGNLVFTEAPAMGSTGSSETDAVSPPTAEST